MTTDQRRRELLTERDQRIIAALDIHRSEPVTRRCTECHVIWPCKTATALGATS